MNVHRPSWRTRMLRRRWARTLRHLAAKVTEEYAQGRLEVMQSSGGIISARLAAAEPVRTMLSGPAGGVIGAYKLACLAGFDHIIGFDMGGTSTDVCLVDAERSAHQQRVDGDGHPNRCADAGHSYRGSGWRLDRAVRQWRIAARRTRSLPAPTPAPSASDEARSRP